VPSPGRREADVAVAGWQLEGSRAHHPAATRKTAERLRYFAASKICLSHTVARYRLPLLCWSGARVRSVFSPELPEHVAAAQHVETAGVVVFNMPRGWDRGAEVSCSGRKGWQLPQVVAVWVLLQLLLLYAAAVVLGGCAQCPPQCTTVLGGLLLL
jgi:hypothetical protein